MTSSTSGPRHGSGVAPALCHAMPQPADRSSPARRATSVALAPELVGVRVAGQHPLGEAVGGEEDLVGLGQRRPGLGDRVGQEVDVLGEQVPASIGTAVAPRGSAASASRRWYSPTLAPE